MRIHARLFMALAVVALLAAPSAVAAPKDDTATVGWFLKEIATARGLSVSSEASAGQVLRDAGIQVPVLDPAKTLTEGDVVEIGRTIGVNSTTQAPQSTFTRTRAQAFISTFRTEVGGRGDESNSAQDLGGTPNPASNAGKGKKKGHNKSSSEPQ